MRHFLVFLFLLFFSNSILALHPNQPIGARATSMGGVSLLPAGFWSVFNNQAGLASEKSWAAGIAYDSYFGIDKNLSLKSAGVIVPTNSGSFGLSMNYFGYAAYSEQKIGLAFGKQLSDFLSVGVQIDYLSVMIGNDYGTASAFTFEIGVLAKLSDQWSIASHVYNPFMVKLGEVNPESTPAVIKFATAYTIDPQLVLIAEYEQSIYDHGIFKFGLEYQLIEQLCVRGGVSSNPDLFSFGFGLNLKGIHLDFGTSYHQTLGFSPKVGLYYAFN
ncbi:MAG: hypothetical protein JW729_02010 [Bacteroidales bacterium]|nr:hypothetical protein [Bacteroidales bacterium]